MRLKLSAFLAFLLVLWLLWYGLYRQRSIDFNTEIKPLLNQSCLPCHGGVKQEGGFSLLTRETALQPTASGRPALLPGDPDNSEMIRRLTCADPEERMPYRQPPLSRAAVDLLRRWVAQGAQWSVHWAYRPVQEPPLPGEPLFGSLFRRDAPWGRNGIDAFVRRRHQAENLQPAPEADPETLLRRVCLDLTGLPPSEALYRQFREDRSGAAWENLVDTLLASPHFGERWTSMWLDLARYADSKGYERDDRRFVWRYRDWLIRAFNADLPYDEFIIRQLAGDLLPYPDDDLLLATTFHRNTPTNDEGGTDNEEFRVAAVLDRVNTTWEALMGTTFACVQCHSHPYDPFFHEDYFQSYAFFNNTRDADTRDDYPLLRHYAGADSLKWIALKNWLQANAPEPEASDALNLLRLWQPVWYSIECDRFNNCELLDTKFLGMSHPSSARLPGVALDGKNRLMYRINTFQPGGKVEIRMDSTNGPLLAALDIRKTTGWAIRHVDFSEKSGIHDLYLVYRNPALASQPEAFGFQFDWFGLTTAFPGKGRPDHAAMERDFFYLLGAPCETTPVLWENPEGMRRSTRIFERGNWLAPGDTVQPGTPAALPPMPAGAPSNRLGLARWIGSPENPLTARVMVNRLWEQLFGIGLVETVEDFGSQGAGPAHPELLDWMAWRFMHVHDWSIKKMLREMVCSATYRQSSVLRPGAFERDPENRLLARGPRVRLSAEQIRDQALLVSGLLNPKLYGYPVMPWQPEGIWQTPWNGQQWQTSTGDEAYRRAVYTYWKRSSPYPSLINFDAATRQLCTARRIRTNTPLQALATLNDPVFLECAKHLAGRMQSAGPGPERQIAHGYLLLTGRKPDADKLQALTELYGESLAYYRGAPQALSDFLHDIACEQHRPERAALAVVANALLNLDETLVKS